MSSPRRAITYGGLRVENSDVGHSVVMEGYLEAVGSNLGRIARSR